MSGFNLLDGTPSEIQRLSAVIDEHHQQIDAHRSTTLNAYGNLIGSGWQGRSAITCGTGATDWGHNTQLNVVHAGVDFGQNVGITGRGYENTELEIQASQAAIGGGTGTISSVVNV